MRYLQNEEISNKTIAITTRSASKVLRFLAKHGYSGIKKINAKRKQNKEIRKSQKQQSYKKLCKSGQGLSTVELNKDTDHISKFAKIAKEYRLGFAVKKDKATGLYTLYFKAKDKEVYDKVFSRYRNVLDSKDKGNDEQKKTNSKSLTEQLSEKKAEAEKINKERAQNNVKKIFKENEQTK